MAGIASLPLFHQIAGQKVLVLGEGEAAGAKARLVERAGGIVETEMNRAVDEGVRLAFVAYDDPRACENAAINLRCAGLLVNVVDMPALCDFTTPSILDRDPLLVAIGTGGASAGLAKHIRLRLERLLPARLGELANALFDAREGLRARFPDGADRRQALDDALREGGALDPMREASADQVEPWLADTELVEGARTETITLRSDDPEDLTLREARLLGEADTLLLGGAIPEPILTRARADAIRVVGSKPEALEGMTVIIRRQ